MNLQPVFEAAGQTEKGTVTRRGWSIEELRERLGVATPAEREKETRKTNEPAGRPRIVKRGMEQAAA
jgi:hypothetical protein